MFFRVSVVGMAVSNRMNRVNPAGPVIMLPCCFGADEPAIGATKWVSAMKL
jgi:hypothetical protein